MMSYLLHFIILLGMIFSHSKETVKIEISSMNDYYNLYELGIELDHHRTNHEVHAYATQDQIILLREKGYNINPIANQARDYYLTLMEESKNLNNPMRNYHNYTEMTIFLNDIASQYPNITSLESIGQSVQGRELWVMHITDNPSIDEPEPKFKYIANMHGDETPGREFLLYLIEWLCENYNINDRATYLVNNTDIYIMPSMNPDGFELGIRYNANGVDLNRDFPDQFTDPSNTLQGRQPETRAVMEWSWGHNFTLSANMHSGALVANYPFDGPTSGVYSACPDDDLFINLSLIYSENHPTMYQSTSYNQGITNGAYWYALNGGMQDWNYVWENNFEITLEQSNTKWPNSNLLPDLWIDNKESLISFMEQVHTGSRGYVVDAITQDPLYAIITVEGIDHPIFNHMEHGDYYRLLTPGTYNITAFSFGYEPLTHSVTIQENNFTSQNFELMQETSEVDDFESASLSNFNWYTYGNSNWIVDNEYVAEGAYAIRSGSINSNQSSSIEITYDVINEGVISFYKKVSCEPTGSITGNYYDYLAFYIDDIQQNRWAGEIDWSFETFDIEPGLHTFRWEYIKDGGVDSGADAAWIDYVIFPNNVNNILMGDINQDLQLNVLDVVLMVNYVLGNEEFDSTTLLIADLNMDEQLDILDVVLLVNLVLN